MRSFAEGCRCYEITYLGATCLVLENDVIRSTMLLDYGATMIEYRCKSRDLNLVWRTPEWKQNLHRRQRMQLDETGISENYLGGWFDIFPNYGAGCQFDGVHYANHGELLYLPWSYRLLEQSPQRLTVRLYTWLSKQACCVAKEITIVKGSSSLSCTVYIENTGGVDVPYQWGVHPTLGAPFLSSVCEIILPPHGGDVGQENLWMLPEDSMKKSLLTIGGFSTGECRVRNHTMGLDFCMDWDAATFPYAQIWLSAGHNYGHHNHGGAYALCIVPCSTQHESLSQGSHQLLYPGGVCRTQYSIYLEE